jgi:hypothetical protein
MFYLFMSLVVPLSLFEGWALLDHCLPSPLNIMTVIGITSCD